MLYTINLEKPNSKIMFGLWIYHVFALLFDMFPQLFQTGFLLLHINNDCHLTGQAFFAQ